MRGPCRFACPNALTKVLPMKLFQSPEDKIKAATISDLEQLLASASLPGHVRQLAENELAVLRQISQSSAEYSISFTYLTNLLDMPWGKKTEDNPDIAAAERILDAYHYGLHQIKERLLEHLSIRMLRMNRKPRILVVDDEEIARKNLRYILEKEGYTVEVASDGLEASAKMDHADFDVVLTDIRMGRMDGLTLLERTKIRSPETQVIIITGFASVDSAVVAIKKGAFHYISKPFKLDEVRTTVREALAGRRAPQHVQGSVLCFVGPPGTGKTSLGKSFAHALGRKFARISLGGMKDEAELLGHRRTYAGARPGRIIEEIRKLGVANPVMMLDEVDKIGKDFKGDPAAALLEVLDPEQNSAFMDNYLEIPFDLSQVMFILTANIVDNIMPPLLDRMEILEFGGYTEEEKYHIAVDFLIPKQIRLQGLSGCPPQFSRGAVYTIIQSYTREAGIRNLEREIATVCRRITKNIVRQQEACPPMEVDPEAVGRFLGPPRFLFELAKEQNLVGVTTGLVWTEMGGDIIFIETAKMKGERDLILTGSLGEVMRESAQAALSYIRSHAEELGIAEDFFGCHDLHIHIPAGAIPKDGPSSGMAIAMALVSLLTGRPARREVAMTGELTLTGRILAVGGVKEKLLAARRAGIKRVLLPQKNRADVEALPLDTGRDLDIRLVEHFADAIDLVLSSP